MHSDDTSVAILEKHAIQSVTVNKSPPAVLHFHEKVTADNSKYAGVHPMIAQDSHQRNLAALIAKAILSLPPIPESQSWGHNGTQFSGYTTAQASAIPVFANGHYTLRHKPDFISVTRGPGLRSCLATGVDTTKGVALGWQIPLVGVNHMQAHALTPRLVSALQHSANHDEAPAFPFLSLLVSGGHTLLVTSKSITDHEILAQTNDIAIGDCLDKIARAIIPSKLLAQSRDAMYGRLLEGFAFPLGAESYDYTPPSSRHDELASKPTKWGWSLGVPLSETRAGKSRDMEFTFTGTQGNVERICKSKGWHSDSEEAEAERVDLARESMRVLFEHLSSRVVKALQQVKAQGHGVEVVVVSGGVASNKFLSHVLRDFLNVRGFSHVRLISPPGDLCSDNAAMIAWAGMEMFEAGWESYLSIQALSKWEIDPGAKDGGILGVDGWKRRE